MANIGSRHVVELMINNKMADILDRDNLNIRMNDVIYNPEEITTTQATYSFSFNLPSTQRNDKIFGYANNLSIRNKFNKIFDAVLYADEIKIFEGKLKLVGYENNEYKCNLVNVVIKNIDDIFGDTTLNNIDWKVPFNGVNTINTVNADISTKYYFPLVSYGAFQKEPIEVISDTIADYTDINIIDDTNRFYVETFSPSLNLCETIKKCFESKGYNCEGSAFNDPNINELFMSTNLANNQDPLYNLGSSLGKVSFNYNWTNIGSTIQGRVTRPSWLQQDLQFPYDQAKRPTSSTPYSNGRSGGRRVISDEVKYNYGTVCVYDMLSNSTMKITNLKNDGYWFRDNVIVIPNSGIYKINFTGNISIASSANNNKKVNIWQLKQDGEPELKESILTNNFSNYPTEIQIIKFNNDTKDENIELIFHGEFPHEAERTYSSSSPRSGNRRDLVTRADDSDGYQGYFTKNNEMICYDRYVNENFICGAKFNSEGSAPSVMKNGGSWNREVTGSTNNRYNCQGYWGYKDNNTSVLTSHNKNTLPNAPTASASLTGTSSSFNVSCSIYLEKNDVLVMKCINKYYNIPGVSGYQNRTGINFDNDVTVNGTFSIEAYSPNEMDNKLSTLSWNNKSKFDENLSLGNFLNESTKMSDFINNFIKDFNLKYNNIGNTVFLDKQTINPNQPKWLIKIDNRVNSKDAKTSYIEYPSSMMVEYSIDEEEAGFYHSVPDSNINDNNWKDYADRGYEKVIMNTIDETNDETISLSNSYCWYYPFKLNNNGQNTTINLPLIAKDEYFIIQNNEAMKHDGKNLKLRYWYRQPVTNYIVKVNKEYDVKLSIPINTNDNGIKLTYNNEDNTLLTNYYNILITPDSNYVEIECYITPQEYEKLKMGSNVWFDDDVYIISEISGYAPDGLNLTTLKLIKKV